MLLGELDRLASAGSISPSGLSSACLQFWDPFHLVHSVAVFACFPSLLEAHLQDCAYVPPIFRGRFAYFDKRISQPLSAQVTEPIPLWLSFSPFVSDEIALFSLRPLRIPLRPKSWPMAVRASNGVDFFLKSRLLTLWVDG